MIMFYDMPIVNITLPTLTPFESARERIELLYGRQVTVAMDFEIQNLFREIDSLLYEGRITHIEYYDLSSLLRAAYMAYIHAISRVGLLDRLQRARK
jgi:hypothetical protein